MTYTIGEAINHIYTVAIERHESFRGEINGRAVECVASGSVLHLEYWITVNGHAAPAPCDTDSQICYTLRNLLGDGCDYDNL